MTEKRSTKTIIGLIIAGVLSIIVALGALGFFQFYQTADNLYNKGNIFGEVPMKDKAVTAVKITGYAENPIATIDGGTKLYLIEFTKTDNDDFGYASLEVKEGDKLIEKLKSTDDLVANPVIVAAKMRKSGADGAVRNYTSEFKATTFISVLFLKFWISILFAKLKFLSIFLKVYPPLFCKNAKTSSNSFIKTFLISYLFISLS